ncbi:MAG: hypothetical protein PUF50_07695 [Erysipelotrichaceae bacterium]|nr:hypothetical protein [Erysipelotrichaceae bacterium]
MNNVTEIVFILDRSGSMSGLEKDTIGGYNQLLKKQKKEKGTAFISTILFDHECEILHDRVNLQNIKYLTEEDYYVRGSTAMLDAIGKAIHHIGNVHKYAREEDRPDKTIFVITTDGMENASRFYTYEKVKSMIKRQEEKYGWEFLFLGANIDATSEGEKFGIRRENSARYINDDKGISCFYHSVAKAISSFRENGNLEDEWAMDIENDYNQRKNI